jgi:hypothetical protein
LLLGQDQKFAVLAFFSILGSDFRAKCVDHLDLAN